MQYKIYDSLVSFLNYLLHERTKKEVINHNFLEFLPIFSGFPQEGVTSQLLFIIYINDLAPKVCFSSYINLFEDKKKHIFSFYSNLRLQIS